MPTNKEAKEKNRLFAKQSKLILSIGKRGGPVGPAVVDETDSQELVIPKRRWVLRGYNINGDPIIRFDKPIIIGKL